MATHQLSQAWKTWQKITFRFFFLFLSFFLFDYLFWAMGALIFDFDLYLEKTLSIFNKPLYWLDAHFYHVGYNPSVNGNLTLDYRFAVVLYISVFIVCVMATAIWSWLDSKRSSYNKLHRWFRVYVRYAIAIIMLGYGLAKLIPLQMPFPGVLTLLKPIGSQRLVDALWNFMGASPAYEKFTGICEILGSTLLLFRRTCVFGSLFMCAILMNVVALNIFYNIPVKIYSSLLLVSTLFLLAPFFQRLIRLFFYQQQISLAKEQNMFQSKTGNLLLNSIGALVIAVILIIGISIDLKYYKKALAHSTKLDKMYDVTSFIANDTPKANMTDELKWKRFVLLKKDTSNIAVIYNEKERQDWYYYKIDSNKMTFTLHDISGAIINWYVFNYISSENNQLSFNGKWKNYDVKIKMKPLRNNMVLGKEKIKWVQDD
jgi:hypothetical protein